MLFRLRLSSLTFLFPGSIAAVAVRTSRSSPTRSKVVNQIFLSFFFFHSCSCAAVHFVDFITFFSWLRNNIASNSPHTMSKTTRVEGWNAAILMHKNFPNIFEIQIERAQRENSTHVWAIIPKIPNKLEEFCSKSHITLVARLKCRRTRKNILYNKNRAHPSRTVNLIFEYFHWKIKPFWDASDAAGPLISICPLEFICQWKLRVKFAFCSHGGNDESIGNSDTDYFRWLDIEKSIFRQILCVFVWFIRMRFDDAEVEIYYSKTLFLGWAHLIAFLLPFSVFFCSDPLSRSLSHKHFYLDRTIHNEI